MSYKIIVSPRAQKEIENAVDYYCLYSESTPPKFVEKIKLAYSVLSQKPEHYPLRYKNIRGYKLKRFPYVLYYYV